MKYKNSMEQEEAVDNPGSESDEDNEKQSKSNAKIEIEFSKIYWKDP